MKNLFFGSDYSSVPMGNIPRGNIYVDGVRFAQYYFQKPFDHNPGKSELSRVVEKGGWVFYRGGMAVDLNFPSANKYFNSIEEMEKWIQSEFAKIDKIIRIKFCVKVFPHKHSYTSEIQEVSALLTDEELKAMAKEFWIAGFRREGNEFFFIKEGDEGF
jgi:hypothetical protein